MNRTLLRALTALALTSTLAGCGLKGALTMPSRSEEIVIRPASGATAPDSAPATPGAEAPASATPQTEKPTEKPAEKKVAPQDDRLPPPPLPGGNPGTARSG